MKPRRIAPKGNSKPVIGAPVPGGMGYQPAVTPVAADMHWLSHMVHGIMIVIVIFVVALILTVILRFNSKRNPTPASFTHNTRIEIAWTLIPVVVLIIIGSFSLPILFKQLTVPTPDLTPRTAMRRSTICSPPTMPWWFR